MPDGARLIDDRQVVLAIRPVVVDREVRAGRIVLGGVRFATLVEKEFREVEVPPVVRRLIQAHQCELDLLVPGRVTPRGGAERLPNQVGVPDRDVHQRPLPGRCRVRDGRFVQMPEVVQLVAAGVLVDEPLRADAGRRLRRVDRPRRKHVTIRLLRRRDEIDQLVELLRERRIRMRYERVRGRFDRSCRRRCR